MNVVKKAAKYYFVNIEVLREIQEINCQKKKYIYIYIYIKVSKRKISHEYWLNERVSKRDYCNSYNSKR